MSAQEVPHESEGLILTDDSRSEWLQWRRGGIGGSEVAALVGLSPFASPMSVWASKTGLTGDIEDNEYMEFGRRAEPMIAPWFTDRTGLAIIGAQTQCEHPDNPTHRCTVDGFVVEDDRATIAQALGVAEIKTTGDDWTEIPDAYQCQGQWQMWVTGTHHCWFPTLHGRKFRIHEMPRDDRAIALLADAADDFWNRHVLTGEPPPADGHRATTAALKEAFPNAEVGKAVDLSDLKPRLAELVTAKAKVKQAKATLEAAENAVKIALGEAEIGTVDGEPLVTWKSSERAGYTVKPTTVRTLRVKGM